MTCLSCLQEIRPADLYLTFQVLGREGSEHRHYCCCLAYLAYEIENTAMVRGVMDTKSPNSKAVRKIIDETLNLNSINKCSHEWWKGDERKTR